MNKNKAHGMAKALVGMARETTRDTTGSTPQEIKGMSRQIAGLADERWGDARATARDASDTPRNAAKPP